MMPTIYKLSFDLLLGSILFPLAVGFWKYKKLNNQLTIFYYYIIIGFLLNFFSKTVIWYNKTLYKPILDFFDIHNTNFIDYFFFLRNFLLLGLFFSLIIEQKKIAQLVKYVGIELAIVCTINYLFVEGYKNIGIFNPTVDAFFCSIIPLLYCKTLFIYDDLLPLNKNPYFWITIGQIMVALIGLFFFFTQNHLVDSDEELFNKLAVGRNVLMIIEQIMYAIAFYYAKNTKYLSAAMSDK